MAEKPTMAVRIPKRLFEEIGAFLKRHGGYLTEAEYVREAVRWKLALDRLEEQGRVSAFRLRYRGRPPSEDPEQPP